MITITSTLDNNYNKIYCNYIPMEGYQQFYNCERHEGGGIESEEGSGEKGKG